MSKWRIFDDVSLVGKIQEITMMELRAHPGEVMTAVSLGAVFVVSRADQPIAIISRPPRIGQPTPDLSINVDETGKISYSLAVK